MPAVVQGLRSAGRVLRIWSAVLQLLLWLWLDGKGWSYPGGATAERRAARQRRRARWHRTACQRQHTLAGAGCLLHPPGPGAAVQRSAATIVDTQVEYALGRALEQHKGMALLAVVQRGHEAVFRLERDLVDPGRGRRLAERKTHVTERRGSQDAGGPWREIRSADNSLQKGRVA